MRLLVTGGAGFMGSNFVRHVLAKYPDYTVVNLDKLTYAGNPANLADVADNPRYRFVQGDIGDAALIDELLPQVDAVVNYAAETHVDRSIDNPGEFLMTDVIGTYTLLEGMRKHGVSRMVQISTDEVFGSTEDGLFTEETPMAPNSPYSASKAGGDLLCRAYHHTYGTPVIVTHSCNFFGPYQYPEKVIPLFITNLLEGKSVPLYGDGRNVREWIHTEDHCNAVDLILHKGEPGEVYNIGSGERISNLELTKLLLDLTGRDEGYINRVADRPGHDLRYAIDATKLRTQLGFAPTVDLRGGLERTVRWYRDHEAWWRPLKANGDKFVDKK
jgi:dTDP-glucose 4,6-dehydratase